MVRSAITILILTLLLLPPAYGQKKNFSIRTITAGTKLETIADTATILNAIEFLKSARKKFVQEGYEVQTLRIATQHFYTYAGNKTNADAITDLEKLDRILKRENVLLSIGAILPPNQYDTGIAEWAVSLIKNTDNINFSVLISSTKDGIHKSSIKAAAEISVALSQNTEGGEGNFRFTASANCPAGIPFFPAAYHEGENSFAVGLESPNLLRDVFAKVDMSNAADKLKHAMESAFRPIEALAKGISQSTHWAYDGIDTSPAPGLDASIGEAIEALTKHPFGGPSTLSACALITGVLKNLDIRTCGYSGLMLPIIEDITLAKRAQEGRFTVQELLLFSSVSGTGLDVVPLPGNTSLETLEAIYHDVAALSLKYTNKALSARLFLIPGKNAGDMVSFKNPYLTTARVMRID